MRAVVYGIGVAVLSLAAIRSQAADHQVSVGGPSRPVRPAGHHDQRRRHGDVGQSKCSAAQRSCERRLVPLRGRLRRRRPWRQRRAANRPVVGDRRVSACGHVRLSLRSARGLRDGRRRASRRRRLAAARSCRSRTGSRAPGTTPARADTDCSSKSSRATRSSRGGSRSTPRAPNRRGSATSARSTAIPPRSTRSRHEGGRWIPNFDPGNVTQPSWGTLTFHFTDCSHGEVDFVSTMPGYGSGHMDLTRLTQPAGVTCP